MSCSYKYLFVSFFLYNDSYNFDGVNFFLLILLKILTKLSTSKFNERKYLLKSLFCLENAWWTGFIVLKDGTKEKQFKEGDVLCETVGSIHRGENRSDKECELVVFYPSKKDMPLSVLHPECEDGN